MLTPILSQKEVFELLKQIQNARRIIICGHRSPDGDALGSSLGLCEYLRKLGKIAHIIMPNPFPDFLKWLPGANEVIIYDWKMKLAQDFIRKADLIFCLDFNALERLENMGKAIENSSATRIVIDHHLAPDASMGSLIISHPEKSSTCELTFRVIDQLGGFDSLSQTGATALYTGMMTDTGGFTYNSNDPEIYFIIGQLLTKGIDKDRIYRNVFNNYSKSRLQLMGYLLYEKLQFFADGHAGLFTLSREEMKQFNYIRGDSEGFVNLPLQIKGMKLSISLREDTEQDVIRVSLRSVDDFPCNEMAERFFNGGGHFNASGGKLPFPMDEAIKTVEKAIEAYQEKLTAPSQSKQ